VAHSDSRAVGDYLRRCAAVVGRHEATLTRLDAVLGDGDHGDNLAAGFGAVLELLATSDPDERPGSVLRRAGHELVASVGGASGPLYGGAFIAAGLAAGDEEALDGATIGRMLEAGATALARRGRCEVGDKTIQDTLRPAADAYATTFAADGDEGRAILAAIRAGFAGMRSTRPLVARRGLALRLGARSAGTLDPGAVSCFLLLRALIPGSADRRGAGRLRAGRREGREAGPTPLATTRR